MATRRAKDGMFYTLQEFQQRYGRVGGSREWEKAGAQEPGVAAPGPGAPQAAATPSPATDAPAGAAESPRAGERPGAPADVAEHPPVCATCAGPTWQKCSGCQTAFLCAGCQADDRLGGREGCSMCRLIDVAGAVSVGGRLGRQTLVPRLCRGILIAL